MARLLHGGFVQGTVLEERDAALGLIAALLHDTGYIQTREDDDGTGAKYTRRPCGARIKSMEYISPSMDIFRRIFSSAEIV